VSPQSPGLVRVSCGIVLGPIDPIPLPDFGDYKMQPSQAEKWASLALFFYAFSLGVSLLVLVVTYIALRLPTVTPWVEKTGVLDDGDSACCVEPVAS